LEVVDISSSGECMLEIIDELLNCSLEWFSSLLFVLFKACWVFLPEKSEYQIIWWKPLN
jgi:hypothetical protein